MISQRNNKISLRPTQRSDIDTLSSPVTPREFFVKIQTKWLLPSFAIPLVESTLQFPLEEEETGGMRTGSCSSKGFRSLADDPFHTDQQWFYMGPATVSHGAGKIFIGQGSTPPPRNFPPL